MRRRLARVDEIPQKGLRFTCREGPFDEEGILLRLPGGTVRAYKNLCRHLPVRLDERDPGTLWDPQGRHLVCAAHGARYLPADGLCVSGPCEGSHLRELPVTVEDGIVWLDEGVLGAFFA